MVATLALFLLAASNGEVLDAAERHLAARKVDEVFFALDGKTWSPEEAPKAAGVLARAGQLSLREGDAIMALQLVQMALKANADEVLAHEVAARGYKAQEQFGPAEEHADKWIRLSHEAKDARLFRAQMALEQGDWDLANELASRLEKETLSKDERQVAGLVRTRARAELKERKQSLSATRELEKQMELALEKAMKMRAVAAKAGPPRVLGALEPVGNQAIVIYTTTWCGFCKKAKAFLNQRGAQFVERDIEKDPGANEELAEKAALAGVRPSGVPVIDVRGTLVIGFDKAKLERLLR
jgi:glutaredoxin